MYIRVDSRQNTQRNGATGQIWGRSWFGNWWFLASSILWGSVDIFSHPTSDMVVSQNGGIPISSTLMGFFIINHPFGGSSCMETPIYWFGDVWSMWGTDHVIRTYVRVEWCHTSWWFWRSLRRWYGSMTSDLARSSMWILWVEKGYLNYIDAWAHFSIFQVPETRMFFPIFRQTHVSFMKHPCSACPRFLFEHSTPWPKAAAGLLLQKMLFRLCLLQAVPHGVCTSNVSRFFLQIPQMVWSWCGVPWKNKKTITWNKSRTNYSFAAGLSFFGTDLHSLLAFEALGPWPNRVRISNTSTMGVQGTICSSESQRMFIFDLELKILVHSQTYIYRCIFSK